MDGLFRTIKLGIFKTYYVYSKDNKYSILVTFVLISHQLDFEN